MVIDFTKTSEDGKYSFSDALHLDDNHTFTEEEIEAMKQERFDNWLAYILAPVIEEVAVETPVSDTTEPTV
jgi:hypothetical protein